jgi:hypothetical protein
MHYPKIAIHGLCECGVVLIDARFSDRCYQCRSLRTHTQQPYIDAGFKPMIVLTLHGYTLDDINAGTFDAALQAIALQVTGTGEIWFRLLHEANCDWYTYGIYSPGGSAAKFTTAFDRMATILRSAGPNVHIQLGLNNKSPKDMDMTEALPFQ